MPVKMHSVLFKTTTTQKSECLTATICSNSQVKGFHSLLCCAAENKTDIKSPFWHKGGLMTKQFYLFYFFLPKKPASNSRAHDSHCQTEPVMALYHHVSWAIQSQVMCSRWAINACPRCGLSDSLISDLSFYMQINITCAPQRHLPSEFQSKPGVLQVEELFSLVKTCWLMHLWKNSFRYNFCSYMVFENRKTQNARECCDWNILTY